MIYFITVSLYRLNKFRFSGAVQSLMHQINWILGTGTTFSAVVPKNNMFLNVFE